MGQSYRELIAWQKAMDLVTEIYRATATFPRDEQYGDQPIATRCGFSSQQHRRGPSPILSEGVSSIPESRPRIAG
jgi:23S rRNA-intervening sequence protein